MYPLKFEFTEDTGTEKSCQYTLYDFINEKLMANWETISIMSRPVITVL